VASVHRGSTHAQFINNSQETLPMPWCTTTLDMGSNEGIPYLPDWPTAHSLTSLRSATHSHA